MTRAGGFGVRSFLLRWALPAIVIGIVAGAAVPAALHGLGVAWDTNRMSLPWLFERVFAWLAYLAMTGSVVYGLLLSTRLLDAIAHRPISFTLHKDLAAFGIAFASVHGALLLLDTSIGFTPLQILVPGLSPYQPVALAFGQVGLYLAIVVLASFYLRRRMSQRVWRTLHYVTFLAFIGSTVHGIAAGTDTSTPWATGIYIGAAVAVTFLLTYRIAVSVATRMGLGPESRASSALAELRRS
jgi:predicted ferric reductase